MHNHDVLPWLIFGSRNHALQNAKKKKSIDCTARQCSPFRRKSRECSIINPALSLLMKRLVIGQRQNAPNFSAFHGHHTVVWFPLVSIS